MDKLIVFCFFSICFLVLLLRKLKIYIFYVKSSHILLKLKMLSITNFYICCNQDSLVLCLTKRNLIFFNNLCSIILNFNCNFVLFRLRPNIHIYHHPDIMYKLCMFKCIMNFNEWMFFCSLVWFWFNKNDDAF